MGSEYPPAESGTPGAAFESSGSRARRDNLKPLAVLSVGIFLLGSLIGALAGLSSSPIVAPLLPLLFTLLTAGGGLWVAISGTKSTAPAERERLRQMSTLGISLVAFVVGFIPGLWVGIAAKLHPDKVWFLQDTRRPAYGDLSFDDPRLLAATINLDRRMESEGLGQAKRRQILSQVLNGIRERTKVASSMTPQDLDALNAILKLPDSSTQPPARPFWKAFDDAMAYYPTLDRLKGAV